MITPYMSKQSRNTFCRMKLCILFFFVMLLVQESSSFIRVAISKKLASLAANPEKPFTINPAEVPVSPSSTNAMKFAVNVPTRFNRVTAVNEALYNDRNLGWFGVIQIGANRQNFTVQFDTGSTELIVTCAGCVNGTCSANHFDCASSSTCTQSSALFGIQYSDDTVYAGHIDSDVVCIGNASNGYCTDKSQQFGCMTFANDTVSSKTIAPDGVLGLGLPSHEGHSPMDQLYANASICPTAEFGVFLKRMNLTAPTGADQWTGEITLCGVDPNHYTGTLNMVPLVSSEEWEIAMSRVTVGDMTIASGSLTALFDTGASLILGPKAAIQSIYTALGLTSGLYYDCNITATLPTVSFAINGIAYTLTARDYMIPIFDERSSRTVCLPGFRDTDRDWWTLGDVFITKFYTVFDHKNKRIGLATAAGR